MSDSDYIAIAQRLLPLGAAWSDWILTMDSKGKITQYDPSSYASLDAPIAAAISDTSGGGFGGGSDSGGGSSEESTASGGAGAATNVSSVVAIVPFRYEGVCENAEDVDTLSYIERCDSLFSAWADLDEINITGDDGVALLESAFDLLHDTPPYNKITRDLRDKGIEIFFDPDFTTKCEDAIACLYTDPTTSIFVLQGPTIPPVILFNPLYLNESVESIANVLVHEGTHFQQFLDGDIFSSIRFWN